VPVQYDPRLEMEIQLVPHQKTMEWEASAQRGEGEALGCSYGELEIQGTAFFFKHTLFSIHFNVR